MPDESTALVRLAKNQKPLRNILIYVKKSLLLMACTALLLVALENMGRAVVPDRFRAAVSKTTLPFKVAMLYAKEPDRQLACPVEGVRVKQVTDTWHAPRSVGRLHEGQDIFAKRGTAVRSATEG